MNCAVILLLTSSCLPWSSGIYTPNIAGTVMTLSVMKWVPSCLQQMNEWWLRKCLSDHLTAPETCSSHIFQHHSCVQQFLLLSETIQQPQFSDWPGVWRCESTSCLVSFFYSSHNFFHPLFVCDTLVSATPWRPLRRNCVTVCTVIPMRTIYCVEATKMHKRFLKRDQERAGMQLASVADIQANLGLFRLSFYWCFNSVWRPVEVINRLKFELHKFWGF